MTKKTIIILLAIMMIFPSTAYSIKVRAIEIESIDEVKLSASITGLMIASLDLLSSVSNTKNVVEIKQESIEYTDFMRDYILWASGVNYNDASLIARTALKYGELRDIDPFLILAMIQTESTFNRKAVGYSNDTGLMQLIPSTAKYAAEKVGVNYSRNSLFEVDYNINLGTWYYKSCMSYFSGKSTYGYSPKYLGLISYNRGPGTTNKELSSGNLVTSYGDKVWNKYETISEMYKNKDTKNLFK